MNNQMIHVGQIEIKPHVGELKVRRFHIHGSKADELMGGETIVSLAASNMAMAMAALKYRFGMKLRNYIADNQFIVYLGSKDSEPVFQKDIQNLGDAEDIYIVPAVEGAGNSRAGQIIMGVAMIVVGIFTIYSNPGSYTMIAQGSMMILGGALTIYTALTTPKVSQQRSAEERESFTFNSAVNVVEQGGPVPLVYGLFLCGSTVVSAGMDTEQMTRYNSPIGRDIAPPSVFGIQNQPL